MATSPQAQQTVQEQGLSLENIREEIGKAIGADAGPQTDLGQVASATSEYLRGPKTPKDRQKAIQDIAQATGKSEAEAEQMVANLEQKAEQAKETGEEVAQVTGMTFIGIAVSMLLGALAAALGGLAAPAPRDDYPYGREHGREVKVERETNAAH